MQKLLLFIFAISVLFVSSCSDDSSDGGGIGPGGGSISFTITGQVDPGNPTNYIFAFQPSIDTKLSKLIVGLPAQPFFDTLTSSNTDYVFSKDTAYSLNPYTGIQTGQAWTFAFTGNIVSNNTAFTTTSNFTIP